jgi:3-hydroxybutyryl-CoA dehydrogenase
VRIAGRDPRRAAAAVARAAEIGAPGAQAAPIGPGAFADADLVLETVVEDADVKRGLLARIEPWCPDAAVITTNTSSLTIAGLAGALARPGRFAGFHFLKPAHLTGVVEVIPGPDTDAAVTERLRAVARAMGKAPLVVRRDAPGFIWNRIQFAVLRECLHMLEAGIASAEDIDAAVSDGLAPRWVAAGPLATADLGGLRTFALVSRGLFPHLAAETEVPAALADRARQGRPFAPWTAAGGPAVAELRAEALRTGARIAARRREIGA